MRYLPLCSLVVGLFWPVTTLRAQLIVSVPAHSAAYTSAAAVSTLAGMAGSKGAIDSSGAAARFARPMGVGVAPNGTVYVADEENMTIRHLSPSGEVTAMAGGIGTKGSADGPGPAARFFHPVGLAVAADGTVFVTDTDNHTIRKIGTDGIVSTLAGNIGRKGTADGISRVAQFNLPHGMAVAANGTLYVADTNNHTIRKITPDGQVTTLAGLAGRKGSTDGIGSAARFFHPAAVAVDGQSNLYVADNGNETIRKITLAGEVTTLAGTAGHGGYANGAGAVARFRSPTGVAVDARGNVYVADHLNALLRQITPAGDVTTLAGMVLHFGSEDGAGSTARFNGPSGIATDASGNLYLTDSENHTVRKINLK